MGNGRALATRESEFCRGIVLLLAVDWISCMLDQARGTFKECSKSDKGSTQVIYSGSRWRRGLAQLSAGGIIKQAIICGLSVSRRDADGSDIRDSIWIRMEEGREQESNFQ